jgi:hypothetical protein
MKTAGYDVALLVNEGLLNQISGALFYSGFLTTHGSVDFYNGKISVKIMNGRILKNVKLNNYRYG